MYIQPPMERGEEQTVLLPRNYSGSVFRREAPPPQKAEEPPSAVAEAATERKEPTAVPEEPLAAPAVEAGDSGEEDAVPAGLLSGKSAARMPFLSSLLPPRHSRRGDSFTDLLVPGVLLLLLWGDEGRGERPLSDELLLFLVVLLLWS